MIGIHQRDVGGVSPRHDVVDGVICGGGIGALEGQIFRHHRRDHIARCRGHKHRPVVRREAGRLTDVGIVQRHPRRIAIGDDGVGQVVGGGRVDPLERETHRGRPAGRSRSLCRGNKNGPLGAAAVGRVAEVRRRNRHPGGVDPGNHIVQTIGRGAGVRTLVAEAGYRVCRGRSCSRRSCPRRSRARRSCACCSRACPRRPGCRGAGARRRRHKDAPRRVAGRAGRHPQVGRHHRHPGCAAVTHHVLCAVGRGCEVGPAVNKAAGIALGAGGALLPGSALRSGRSSRPLRSRCSRCPGSSRRPDGSRTTRACRHRYVQRCGVGGGVAFLAVQHNVRACGSQGHAKVHLRLVDPVLDQGRDVEGDKLALIGRGFHVDRVAQQRQRLLRHSRFIPGRAHDRRNGQGPRCVDAVHVHPQNGAAHLRAGGAGGHGGKVKLQQGRARAVDV